jgi:hypothetical protein
MDDAEGRDRLFNWMIHNYDTIMSRVPPMFSAFMPYFASGCSSQRLDAARAFFGDGARSNPGTQRTLAKVGEQVGDCVGLREREGDAVGDYLKDLNKTP